MDIPSLFMIPSAVSSGKVHSVFPNSTDADFDFNRDSDATRVNSEGLIERVGYYGSELILNPNFDDTSFWGVEAGVTIANNRANFNTAQTNYGIYKASLLTNSKTYKVQFEITDYTSGGVHFNIGGVAIGSYTALGTHTLDVSSGSGTNVFAIQSNSGGAVLSIDNVSVKEVTGDRARLNYEIEGGLVNTKPSLLLEPQSTNLLPYSENFSNWSTINATSTSNYSISPSGELNATRFLTSGESNSYLFVTGISTTASQQYTVSFYVKSNKNGLDDFKIYTSLAGGDSVVFTATENWQRFDHTVTATSTSIFVGLRGVSGKKTDVLVYGAQFEQQSYPTSYIPTNGSVQTRTSETCNGAGTSSIFNDSEGILYAEISALADDFATYRFISLYDGTYDNICDIYYGDASNRISVRFRGGGGTVINMFFAISDIMLFNKVAISWKLNKFKFFINGVSRGLNTSGAAPVGLDRLDFNQTSGSNPFYGKIRDIRVYNTKEMTDSEVDILLTKITS